jgi:hypothetical protein
MSVTSRRPRLPELMSHHQIFDVAARLIGPISALSYGCPVRRSRKTGAIAMIKIALRFTVLASVLACSLPACAGETFIETWVSHTGSDSNACNSPSSPCKTLAGALDQTFAGGQINVMDAGDFGSVVIQESVSIVNAISGTAINIGAYMSAVGQPSASIIIVAGANGVVTVRGLVLNGDDSDDSSSVGVLINNASQVNIENCLILNSGSAGVEVVPSVDGLSQTLAASINVNIQDSTITGNGGGINIAPTTATPINVVIDKTRINNNAGGGLKANGTSGGPITVSISDSSLSLNSGNGVNAVGSSHNVIVNVNNAVIASNGTNGVQANGATAAVLVSNTSILDNTAGAMEAIGSGRVLTYGNNRIMGSPGTGFTGTASLQ